MAKGIFTAKEATASTFKCWNARLLLGAGILSAVGCTIAIPVEDNGATPPPTNIATTAPVNDDEYPPQGLTPDPADTPTSFDTPAPFDTPTPPYTFAPVDTPTPGDGSPTTTPEADARRRPIPNVDNSTFRRIPDTPVPEPTQLLPQNTLALVMAVSGGGSSSTLKTVINDSSTGAMLGTKFIQLESSSKSVVLYLPDSGEATVIDSYSPPSYAPHFKRPYTVDDRLYVSNKYTDGGALSITEYDAGTLDRKSEWGTQTDALDPGYAVAGGQVYFKTGSTQQWSMSRGFYNAPGDYISSPFSSRWESNELEKPELSFGLVSGGAILYGAKLPSEADPITGVFTVDPDTGQPADRYTTAFEIEDWDDYHPSSWQNVLIEHGTAYWAGFRAGPLAYTVEVLAADLTDPDVFTVYEFDIPSNGKEITGFNSTIDADGGYVLIKPFYEGGDRSKVLIFDTTKETAQLFDTGFHITDAQLIYIEG